MGLITTEQAGQILDVRRRHIQHLIRTGKLKAYRVGHAYVLEEEEVRRFAAQSRKAGRPRKER